jgi:g-D-glutamyl-meso-diaminopimelate peptidase
MRTAIAGWLLSAVALLSACAPAVPDPTTTPAPTPSVTPAPAQALRPTQTPRPVRPADTATPRPTPTRWPLNLLSFGDGPPPATLDPALIGRIQARAGGGFNVGYTQVGRSVEGRPLVARSFGTGERLLMLVGGLHGGWEANTVSLVDALVAYFEAHPEDVLPGVRLVLIPAANPDGLLRGRTPEGRFNTNGVDLNRNWGCDWSAQAVWRDQPVDPGPYPLSEPETMALAETIRLLRPAAVVFYHSAAAGIYAGDCASGRVSETMASVLGEATGYSHGAAFSAYAVSGTAANWVDGLGIPAVDLELETWTDSELERNLRGVMALQAWVTAETP